MRKENLKLDIAKFVKSKVIPAIKSGKKITFYHPYDNRMTDWTKEYKELANEFNEQGKSLGFTCKYKTNYNPNEGSSPSLVFEPLGPPIKEQPKNPAPERKASDMPTRFIDYMKR